MVQNLSNSLDNVSLKSVKTNFRDFSLFNFDFERQNCPSARCALVANAINSDNDIFKADSHIACRAHAVR
jgi:hypothetical protein